MQAKLIQETTKNTKDKSRKLQESLKNFQETSRTFQNLHEHDFRLAFITYAVIIKILYE